MQHAVDQESDIGLEFLVESFAEVAAVSNAAERSAYLRAGMLAVARDSGKTGAERSRDRAKGRPGAVVTSRNENAEQGALDAFPEKCLTGR